MFVAAKLFQAILMFVGKASGLYYKTITIVIMTIVSDATIWSVTFDDAS